MFFAYSIPVGASPTLRSSLTPQGPHDLGAAAGGHLFSMLTVYRVHISTGLLYKGLRRALGVGEDPLALLSLGGLLSCLPDIMTLPFCLAYPSLCIYLHTEQGSEI